MHHQKQMIMILSKVSIIGFIIQTEMPEEVLISESKAKGTTLYHTFKQNVLKCTGKDDLRRKIP